MDIDHAIDLVSYKLGLKNGEAALEDKILNRERILQAITDKKNDQVEAIDLKQYMVATKLVKQQRTELFRQRNEGFLNQLDQDPEVQTLSSGLKYRIIQKGTGPKVSPQDTVTVHYKGTLIDGHIFDQTEAEKPATFLVHKVIKGWQQGLQEMNKGAIHVLYIPQEMAYGERGNDSKVPPYATLVFEVELLDFH